MIVIDASAALAWLLPSQSTPEAWTFLERTADQAYVAPFTFEWEVRNALLVKAKQGVLPRSELQATLDRVSGYGVASAEAIEAEGVTPLALSQEISLFDAAYLALALDLAASLASLDRALLRAAFRCGVDVHDLRAVP